MFCGIVVRIVVTDTVARHRRRFRNSCLAVHMRSSACGRAEYSWPRLAMLCANIHFGPSVLVSKLTLVANSNLRVTNRGILVRFWRRIRAVGGLSSIRLQCHNCRHRRRGTVRTNLPRQGGTRYQWLSVSLSTFVALVATLQGLVGLTSGVFHPRRSCSLSGSRRSFH